VPGGTCDCPACALELLSQVIAAVSLPRPSRRLPVATGPLPGESAGCSSREGACCPGAAAGVEAELADAGLGAGEKEERDVVQEIVVPQLSLMQMGEDLVRTRGGREVCAQSHEQPEHRTTVLLKSVGAMGVHGVCRMLDQLGLACAYDIVRMGGRRRRGCAFVNFLLPAQADACIRLCNGRVAGGNRSHKAVVAEYAACQGASFVAKSMLMHFQKQLDPICQRGNVA